jgi:CspA family cold shock protein
MPYRDTMAVCEKCGKEFIFRIEEQRELAARGADVVPPALCPEHRREAGAERAPKPARKTEAETESKVEATVALGPGPHEGTVKWFDPGKGYGFIAHPSGEEIFFHRSGIAQGEEPRFPDDTPVTFLIEQTEKGPQAVDVARMDGETEGQDD